MNISWTNVKAATLHFLDQIKLKGEVEAMKVEWGAYTRPIYHHFYRPVTRPATQLVPDMDEWKSYACNAVFKPRSRWDKKMLQVQRAGHNRFISKEAEFIDSDDVITIYHQVRSRPTVSRINVLVKASAAGQPLYEKLRDSVSSSSASVSDWKVMNPVLGSSGPDSAVIYLNEALNSANVIELIDTLQTILDGDLEANSLFGLQTLAAGLYGCDIPSSDIQQHLLKIPPRDLNSAGTIISAVISKAVVVGYQSIIKNQISSSKQAAYIKAVLKNVLEKDLNWELAA